jgi:hypothetical protein
VSVKAPFQSQQRIPRAGSQVMAILARFSQS